MIRWNSRYADRGEAHRGARVAVADLLHRVHRQHPDQCRRPGCRGRSSPPGTPAGAAVAGPSAPRRGLLDGLGGVGAGDRLLGTVVHAGCSSADGPGPADPSRRRAGPPGGRAEILITASVVLRRPTHPATDGPSRAVRRPDRPPARHVPLRPGSDTAVRTVLRVTQVLPGARGHRAAVPPVPPAPVPSTCRPSGGAPPPSADGAAGLRGADQAAHRRAAAGHHAAGDDPGRPRAAAAGHGAGHA